MKRKNRKKRNVLKFPAKGKRPPGGVTLVVRAEATEQEELDALRALLKLASSPTIEPTLKGVDG